MTTITGFTLTRFQFPRQRPIGDSQIRVDQHHIVTLELHSSAGHTGLGFAGALLSPLPPLAELERVFTEECAPGLLGQNIFALTNRVRRPRGGNIRPNFFGQAIDQAVWDLQGKALGLPLYKLLGGTSNRVRAYASGLEFHLPTEQACALFASAAQQGFTAFKMKVGHPDLAWDLARIGAVVQTVGTDKQLMVDANEAWSPKEAIRRAHAYRDAGFNILGLSLRNKS